MPLQLRVKFYLMAKWQDVMGNHGKLQLKDGEEVLSLRRALFDRTFLGKRCFC